MRKGTKLARVQQLYDEGSGIRIHFEAELRPLRAALAAADQWRQENASVLKGLGLLHDEDSVTVGVEGAEPQQSGMDRVNVPYDDLVYVAKSASDLLIDFEPARYVF